jgi:hypothetical protein
MIFDALTSFKGKDWRVAKKDDGYYLQAAAFAQLDSADGVWTSAEALITIWSAARVEKYVAGHEVPVHP